MFIIEIRNSDKLINIIFQKNYKSISLKSFLCIILIFCEKNKIFHGELL